MAQLLSTNVTGTLNVSSNVNIGGLVIANSSPLSNIQTQLYTGVACYLKANAQTNGNLAQTNVMSVTFNETGVYKMSALFLLGTVGTANLANIGMNCFPMGSGTYVANFFNYGLGGNTGDGTLSISSPIIVNSQFSIANIANATNSADYVYLEGIVNVSTTGTAQTQIAAQNTANGNLMIMSNSYITFIKIG